LRRIDTRAGVGDRHRNLIICAHQVDGQDTVPDLNFGHRFDGIAYEIENDLLDLNAIGFDMGQ